MSATAVQRSVPRVVYACDFGCWFKMTPRAWAEVIRDALAHPQHEWNVIGKGRVLQRRPRCIKSMRMDSPVRDGWGRVTSVRDYVLLGPSGVEIVYPRDEEKDNRYWAERAVEVVSWGLGHFERCGWCDACLEAPDEPCESPRLVLAEGR